MKTEKVNELNELNTDIPILEAKHLVFEYRTGAAKPVRAVYDVSFSVWPGEFIGLIGHTGSGKSTLLQLLNALETPASGTVYFKGQDIFEKRYDRKKLRGKVGLVFQYPEHQLFAETVFADVCFGPLNMGVDRKQAELTAYDTIKQVGLEDECFYKSPFDLSGGQKRRAAIAGVLAMKPEVLILDEPTAGLDPKGRDELLDMIASLRDKENMTIILVSHSMEDVARYADRIMVMNEGRLILDDTVSTVFKRRQEIKTAGLSVPEVSEIVAELSAAGLPIRDDIFTVDEAAEEILRVLKEYRVI
ncbi:MAG: energy-coupling factor transporter ATPase [Lachnospiraceae bacterium]|nr:energy-coupling factor transporter ATPase [Lachnospiraceae bacterium]